jgi:phosphatidylserine/phosphatidylglycerophosphate/cardiolipin synthase-like enzyme
VRIFNPFVLRGVFKKLGYVTEFSRNNRRMHNKSFSADGQTSIVGGCNVGNEYFGATDGMMLADLDVLVIGPVVRDIELLPSMGNALFVGSFNLDPRSMHLNTEMGLLIDSPTLAQGIHRTFDKTVPLRAYQVTLGEDGRLRWDSGVGNPPPVYDTEPNTRWYQRWMLRLWGWLPMEWLL